MPEFVFKIDKKDIASLGAVRCVNGLQVAADNDMIWLRGLTEAAGDSRVRQLPVKSTFVVDEKGNLFLPACLTPIDTLKEMSWQPLSTFIEVELPVSALPGKTGEQVPVKLVPSSKTEPGYALLTSLTNWKQYAETAPVARLHFLRFAVSEKNEVLVTGNPLPPLPGIEYWQIENILLPAGYDFEIKMAAGFINGKVNKNGDNLLVFDTDGHCQPISKNLFVPARRSAIRSTEINGYRK